MAWYGGRLSDPDRMYESDVGDLRRRWKSGQPLSGEERSVLEGYDARNPAGAPANINGLASEPQNRPDPRIAMGPSAGDGLSMEMQSGRGYQWRCPSCGYTDTAIGESGACRICGTRMVRRKLVAAKGYR